MWFFSLANDNTHTLVAQVTLRPAVTIRTCPLDLAGNPLLEKVLRKTTASLSQSGMCHVLGPGEGVI